MTAGPANGEVKISVLLTRLAYLGCTPKQESLGVCVCVSGASLPWPKGQEQAWSETPTLPGFFADFP